MTQFDVHVQRAERLLLAHSATPGGSAKERATAAGKVYTNLRRALAPVVGEAGVQALFARSLKLTRPEHPCLKEIQLPAEQVEHGLQLDVQLFTCLSKREPEAATAIATAVFAVFLRLLTDFIGVGVLRQLATGAFPTDEANGPKETSR